MERLKNKVAIITGGASGIGKVTARLFAAEGAAVVITDINEPKLNLVAEEIAAFGGKVLAVKQDVTSEEDWKAVVHSALAEFGRIDILFNNAGIEIKSGKWADISLEDFQRILNVNLVSQFLGIKAVSNKMISNGKGSIINMSSTAGFIATMAHPAYTASKGGSRLLTKAAAKEYATSGLRVNSIHPGITLTELTIGLMDSEEGRNYLKAANPMQRAATGDEIANAVLFLASDESSFVTGTELVIDGGQISV